MLVELARSGESFPFLPNTICYWKCLRTRELVLHFIETEQSGPCSLKYRLLSFQTPMSASKLLQVWKVKPCWLCPCPKHQLFWSDWSLALWISSWLRAFLICQHHYSRWFYGLFLLFVTTTYWARYFDGRWFDAVIFTYSGSFVIFFCLKQALWCDIKELLLSSHSSTAKIQTFLHIKIVQSYWTLW